MNDLKNEEEATSRPLIDFLKRMTFMILSTLIVVFFSEKMYWYIQGYALGELVLFYFFGVYIFIWSIDYFQVNDFWSLFLSAMLYSLYVEGILTGLITAAGLAAPILAFYYYGWHSLISIVFGWYLLRKWLLEGNDLKLFISSSLMGVFWGLWSLGYWLPEIVNSPELQEEPFDPGKWRIERYATLVLVFGAMLIVAHWLLGKDELWSSSFRPTRIENGIIAILLGGMFALQLFLWQLLAIPLILMFAIVFYALKKHKEAVFRNESEIDSYLKVIEENHVILEELVGEVRLKHAAILLIMPFISIVVYGTALVIDPAEYLIHNLYWTIVGVQTTVGGILGITALWKTMKRVSFSQN